MCQTLRGHLKAVTALLSWMFLLLLSSHGFAATPETQAPGKTSVAIIGGGMSGATAAYALSQLSKDIEITVFEAEDVPGGRLQEALLDNGAVVELGGSIGIPANQYFVQFSELLGLKRVHPGLKHASVGAWDGEKFRIKFKDSLWSRLSVIGRYGLSPLAASWLVKRLKRKFNRIYDIQAKGTHFDSSADLWQAMGLRNFTTIPLADFLHNTYTKWGVHLISKPYIDEIVGVLSRANYNQPPSTITALAGLVAMASDGAAFQIANGTSQIPAGLLKLSRATVHTYTRVVGVRPAKEAMLGLKKELQRVLASNTGEEDGNRCSHKWHVDTAWTAIPPKTFDAVVIAAPMETADLQVEGAPKKWPPPQPYKTVYTTFIRGELDPEYFKMKPGAEIPDFIGTVEGSTAPFQSLNRVAENPEGPQAVFKTFTGEDVRKRLLNEVFKPGAEIVAERRWAAYPHFQAPETLGPFRVNCGLYYTNAIEAGASCIEISAIAGVNAARLVQRDLNIENDNSKWLS